MRVVGGFTKGALTALLALPAVAASADHELENRDLRNGKALYARECASCHGADLEGQPNWRRIGKDGVLPAPPHDESGHTWHHGNQLLFDYTKLGGKATLEAAGVTGVKSGMPGFAETMSDEGIWDVLAYIRSTWSGRIRRIQATRNPPHD